MPAITQAQNDGSKSPVAFDGPDHAKVAHYIAVARQMRAEAMADLIGRAFRALARVTHIVPAARRRTAQAA